jgi:hypothetical protein
VPDWTDDNSHDPGPAILELIGWLAGVLLFALGLSAYLRRREQRRRRSLTDEQRTE